MSKDHGGPAFPIPMNPGETYESHSKADGMTLRDYFAAKAMHGYCMNPAANSATPDQVAESAYRMADAMLKERAK